MVISDNIHINKVNNKRLNVNIGKEILLQLKEEITEVEYNRYIKQLSYDEKKSSSTSAIFYAPNALVSNWIKNKFTAKLEHLFEVKTSNKVSVKIGLKNSFDRRKKIVEKNPKSLQHSEKAGQTYNPLFIYGGVGLGKTHLMQAAGNVLLNQDKNVIFTTSEQFLNDFLRHVRNQTMDNFKEKYRKCDILLIDDIQFLSNKDTIQEEFFHTFEALKGAGKQIILTADKHPKKIAGLEKRLQSRFEHGLVADIQPPELETKIAIIKNKCELNKVDLTPEIIKLT